MRYDVSVKVNDGDVRDFVKLGVTAVRRLWIDWSLVKFEEFTVKPHVCDHRWYETGKILDSDVAAKSMTIKCSKCQSSFELSHTLLTDCYQNGLKAKEHGF